MGRRLCERIQNGNKQTAQVIRQSNKRHKKELGLNVVKLLNRNAHFLNNLIIRIIAVWIFAVFLSIFVSTSVDVCFGARKKLQAKLNAHTPPPQRILKFVQCNRLAVSASYLIGMHILYFEWYITWRLSVSKLFCLCGLWKPFFPCAACFVRVAIATEDAR